MAAVVVVGSAGEVVTQEAAVVAFGVGVRLAVAAVALAWMAAALNGLESVLDSMSGVAMSPVARPVTPVITRFSAAGMLSWTGGAWNIAFPCSVSEQDSFMAYINTNHGENPVDGVGAGFEAMVA